MESNILQLVVPSVQKERDELRRNVALYFSEHDILPPISHDSLLEHAQNLIKTYKWNENYLAFVMVCCGNEVWRKVVQSTHYSRRILLLPECLKNSLNCKAKKDELGLICVDCEACPISEIINQAEELGYTTLVMEGTTIAAKLIEGGKIDAVIGVGCMDSLQKMFELVTKYAVPGIGIPLLGDGCKDTETDVKWLKEEIKAYHKSEGIKLINQSQLREKVSNYFKQDGVVMKAIPGTTITDEIAREALVTDGHRWRPFLSALAYESLSNEPDPEITEHIALSIECFHKASLIHDDIEDNDIFRNGFETIHKKYGVPVALNVGDFLIGHGYRLLAESPLPKNVLVNCIKIASQGHIDLTLGQGEELYNDNEVKIYTVDEILKIFENKTSAAFNVSLLIGATAGNADEKLLKQLKEFSKYVGIAYQIKDDLGDYKGENGDILFRNFSVLLSVLFDDLNKKDRMEALELIHNKNWQKIFELIHGNNIVEKTHTLLRRHIQNAYQSISNVDKLALKLALHEIMGKIFNDYI